MSFRGRLSLFFVLIVLVPMVSVAVVLFRLIADNETGKADAQVAARQEVVINLYRQATADAQRVIEDIGGDRRLARALQEGEQADARRRAAQLAEGPEIARIVLSDASEIVFDAGQPGAIAPAGRRLEGPEGREFGLLQVSVIDAAAFGRRVRRLAGVGLVVRAGGELLASSVPGVGTEELPDVGDVSVDGREFRVATFDARGFAGRTVRVSVVAAAEGTSSAVARSRVLAAGILLGFFILAFTFAVAVSRSLQQQIAGLLEAARRLGAGDFTAKVPTQGRDEFAALGGEFNEMAGQLERRLEDLRLERERVQTSVRRLGQAVGSNLDRDALLGIVVTTAMEGVGAQGARVTVRSEADGPMAEATRVGSLEGLEEAVRSAERHVLLHGETGEATINGASALAHPLSEGDGEHRRVNGLVSVGRRDRPFTSADRELFRYLAGQASVSIENVGLHETVARESVTDELTGLANRRRFDELMELEVERTKRFGQELGLVMVDLDDFKVINDTYGHQQGDLVLREVARVVRESSREIDEPARYGGEELAIVLPGTDLEGAFRLAERMREGIEELHVERLDGGRPLQVTASFGVAALPETAADEEALVAAADAALYEAKRDGKNRTVRATGG